MADTFFKVSIPSASEQVPSGSSFGVSYEIVNKKDVKDSESFVRKFEYFNNQFFIEIVGEIHKYLLRLTPAHTGQLRGGFTAFLEKYRIDYSRQLYDTALYNSYKAANKTEEHKDYAFNNSAISKGKSKSRLEDNLPKETDVAIFNDVEYMEKLNYGTSKVQGSHFVEQALYKGEFWLEKHFELWFAAMAQAGAIVEPPAVGEIEA